MPQPLPLPDSAPGTPEEPETPALPGSPAADPAPGSPGPAPFIPESFLPATDPAPGLANEPGTTAATVPEPPPRDTAHPAPSAAGSSPEFALPDPAPAASNPSLTSALPDPAPASAPEAPLPPSSSPEPPLVNPVEQVLTRIASAASEAGLREFLLVGGNAVILHGVPRFTRDVDFLVPMDLDLAWRDFLAAHGFSFDHGTPGFAQFSGADPACPRVDLMFVDRSTWEKLLAEAETKPLSPDLEIQLPVPHHLIAMKLRAARSRFRANPEQDWADIVALMQRHGYSLDEPSFRQLVLQFSGEEGLHTLRERLDRLSSP